jgi:molecular chaperone GrpE
MEMTVQLFDTALTRIGVQTIDEAGVRFDPDQHQAMMLEPSVEVEAGAVLRVLQKGYRMSDRLVRPAMVVVAAKAPAPAAPANPYAGDEDEGRDAGASFDTRA